MDLKNRVGVHRLYASDTGYRAVAGCCEHGNETSYLQNAGYFLPN